ncbi:MAG: glycosyltransferase family 2 protein [Nanoarchaeota archaeon]|nr:glycosyltransferase family 2 protein [Nanoarchaeota archaeon]
MEISVIIPAYNEEKYIDKCISSLLEQDYKDYEVIVIDDGSTDDTVKIIKKFPKVILKKQNHKGPGEARNLGAKIAKGKILVFVDADMRFPKNYLTRLTKPIIMREAWGTIHSGEKIANGDKYIAVCWGPVIPLDKDGKGLIFRAITKEKFFEFGGFDSKEGYADDQSIMKKSGVKSTATDAFCYHYNPDTFKDVFVQSKWIGSSYRFSFLDISILNILGAFLCYLLFYPLIILNAFNCMIREKKISYFFIYIPFGFVKYNGRFFGMLRRIFYGKRIK